MKHLSLSSILYPLSLFVIMLQVALPVYAAPDWGKFTCSGNYPISSPPGVKIVRELPISRNYESVPYSAKDPLPPSDQQIEFDKRHMCRSTFGYCKIVSSAIAGQSSEDRACASPCTSRFEPSVFSCTEVVGDAEYNECYKRCEKKLDNDGVNTPMGQFGPYRKWWTLICYRSYSYVYLRNTSGTNAPVTLKCIYDGSSDGGYNQQ